MAKVLAEGTVVNGDSDSVNRMGIGFFGEPCHSCECLCSLCAGGAAPETLTVTFSGFTDKSPGPYLCKLLFASCFGSGAVGVVTQPGGGDPGPISAVSLQSQGSGYAMLGRVAPTVTAGPDDDLSVGSGATFTVTLQQYQNECGVDEWKVSKVVGSGGSGFVDDEFLRFTVAEGDTAEGHAYARVKVERSEPDLTVGVSGGSGVSLSATFVQQANQDPPLWEISSVSVIDGGDGYAYTDSVVLALGEDNVEAVPASFSISVKHSEPSLTTVIDTAVGSGAQITASLTPTQSESGASVWGVGDVTIQDGGSGYAAGETISVLAIGGHPDIYPAFVSISEVDENGAITAIAIGNPGEYFGGGEVTSVTVNDGGSYYRNTGEVADVLLDSGGVYYREDSASSPYVAQVSVTIDQTPPSDGSGGQIAATVGQDPQDEATFGKITGLSITSAGSNYLAWEWQTNDCCGHLLNNKPIVLARHKDSNAKQMNGLSLGPDNLWIPRKCLYSHRMCGGLKYPYVWEDYASFGEAIGGNANALEVHVGLGSGQFSVAEITAIGGAPGLDMACFAAWKSESPIESCDNFSWTATDGQGRTIAVAPGGEYDPANGLAGRSVASCWPCCNGYAAPPDEVVASVQDIWTVNRPANLGGSATGDYVLSRVEPGWWLGGSDDLLVGVEIGFATSVWRGTKFFWGCQQSPCSSCIKKCAVRILVRPKNYPVGGLYGLWVIDARDMCWEQWGGGGCGNCHVCEETPICSPVGRSFSLLGTAGSDTYMQNTTPAYEVTIS